MITIVRADEHHSQLLAGLGQTTFIESHGSSAATPDINSYVKENYDEHVLRNELADTRNIYHLIYYHEQPAGYSKVVFNSPTPSIPFNNITKLERLYLLKEYYTLQLGMKLLHYNIELSKQHGQYGMWLFVWVENQRAIKFYKKNGFLITGSKDFKITAEHSNPNHEMFLQFH